jgi:hypothetical protein
LNPVAPEAVQEYRISTNNYSAEYGRTAGFIANAVTRAGGSGYHGIVYEYLKNDVLNSNDFTDNLNGLARRPLKQNQFGYQAGGPILKDRLFFSSALEDFFSHSKLDPATYTLPTTNFIPALNLPATRQSRQLLQEFPGPTIVSPTGALTAKYTTSQPVVVERLIALERGDYVFRGGQDHLMGRLNIARVTEPDFNWYVYPQFVSALYQHTTGAATNWMHTFTPRLTSEFKLSVSDDNLWWGRAHPEIPTLSSADGVLLPGSPQNYDYRNHNRSFEAIYSAIWTRNRHVISAGAGYLKRHNSGYQTLLRDGEYGFSGVVNFAFDQPSIVYLGVDALAPVNKPTTPDTDRSYDYSQLYLFAQDSFHVSSRLTLNYGLRYENFGAPVNTGKVKDTLVQLGAGGDFTTRLESARLQLGSGNQKLYAADNLDFAPRAGFTWDVFGKSKTLVRGSYGMFYDRPFDNIWQSVRVNSVLSATYALSGTFNYLRPIPAVLPTLTSVQQANNIVTILMDPKLKNGYAQTAFIGVQQAFGDNLTLEVNATASRDRRLLTSDIVNRQLTLTTTFDGRPNDNLPDIEWRSSQGKADYSALTTLVRYRLRTLTLQGSYTWSRSIDNQSDPLGAEATNLGASAVGGTSQSAVRSAFAVQYNSNADRGNSDFDQRHNVFLLGIWQSDKRSWYARGWQFSWLAAFRTGFPYSVESPQGFDFIYGVAAVQDQRADVFNPAGVYLKNPKPAAGGKYLINASAFSIPVNGLVGNTGRNAFRGPGLYNVDVSLARSFGVKGLWKFKAPETTRLTFRADAFNILNHANLNNPDNVLGDANFGLATYGRQGTASGFPSVSPVNETSRQIQMMVRLEF